MPLRLNPQEQSMYCQIAKVIWDNGFNETDRCDDIVMTIFNERDTQPSVEAFLLMRALIRIDHSESLLTLNQKGFDDCYFKISKYFNEKFLETYDSLLCNSRFEQQPDTELYCAAEATKKIMKSLKKEFLKIEKEVIKSINYEISQDFLETLPDRIETHLINSELILGEEDKKKYDQILQSNKPRYEILKSILIRSFSRIQIYAKDDDS